MDVLQPGRDGSVRNGHSRCSGQAKMLQNGRITGHASTERNGGCGPYKEVAGSNPAAPTYKTPAKAGILHAKEGAGKRIPALLLQPLSAPDVSSAYLARRSGRHWTACSCEPFGRPSAPPRPRRRRLPGAQATRSKDWRRPSSEPTTSSEARRIRQAEAVALGPRWAFASDITHLRPPGVRSLVIRPLISRLHHPVRAAW